MDASYQKEGSPEDFLEKEVIKGFLESIDNPEIFFSRLKEKLRTVINDHSVKLAIRVYEVASINAARGLIQASGLNKKKVIILYDTEIDSQQAQRWRIQ